MNKERFVEEALNLYFDFLSSLVVDDKQILWDLEAAIKRAELNDIERKLISLRYLKEPEAPLRDKLARNGHANGRPPGGTTQVGLVELLLPRWEREAGEKMLSKIKKSAIVKIAAELDGYYDQYNEGM